MKKKIIGIAIVTMIGVAAAWNTYESKSDVTLRNMTLDNVEALAGGEGDCPNGCVGGGKGCYCNGSYPSDKEAA